MTPVITPSVSGSLSFSPDSSSSSSLAASSSASLPFLLAFDEATLFDEATFMTAQAAAIPLPEEEEGTWKDLVSDDLFDISTFPSPEDFASASSSKPQKKQKSNTFEATLISGIVKAMEASLEGPWKELSRDTLFKISTFLSPEDVAHASMVCKIWNRALDQRIVWKKQCEIQEITPCCIEIQDFFNENVEGINSHILSIIAEYDEDRGCDYKKVFKQEIPNAITPKFYETHFRDVKVTEPKPRPATMRKENNKPDPDFPDLTIGQTHIWTYRPELQIKGEKVIFSIDLLKKLAEKPLKGFSARFVYQDPHLDQDEIPDDSQISLEQRKASIGNPGWYLMRNTVFKGTVDVSFEKQKTIVREKGYEIPSGPNVILTALSQRILMKSYFGHHRLHTRTSTLNANGKGHWTLGYNNYYRAFTATDVLYDESRDVPNGLRYEYGLTGIKEFS